MVVVIIQLGKKMREIGITEEVYRIKVKLGKIERMRMVEVERTRSSERQKEGVM